MTFSSSPLAIDGAQLQSSDIRRGNYNAMSGAEGITERADLKVSQLAVPGNGLLIAAGNGTINNRYQDTVRESYAISNPDVHTVLSASMPTSQPTTKSYLVLATVGDPEFSQIDHPWMTSGIVGDDAVDFVYVRPWLMEVAAGTTNFASLGLKFPAIALARLDVPANTTTYTNAMLTDLRKLARPRSLEYEFVMTGTATNNLNAIAPAFEDWSEMVQNVAIPSWATIVKASGFIQGALLTGDVALGVGVTIVGGGSTPNTAAVLSHGSVNTREAINFAGQIDVSAIAGTTKSFRIRANTLSAFVNRIASDTSTTSYMRLRFEEAPL